MFRKLVIIAFVLGLAGGALAVTIGNPTAANGWDCSTYITVTASNSASTTVPVDTIDGNGMDAATGLLHGTKWPDMWYAENNDVNATLKYDSSMTAAGPVWIAYEFDAVYYLTSVTIWNFNEFSGLGDGSWQGIKDCTISYSTTGTGGWTEVSKTLTKAPADGWDKVGTPNPAEYAADDTFAINANAKYVVITAATGAAGTYDVNVTGKYGLSEVRFTADVNFATAPDPYSGETDILTDQILSWVKGDGSDIVKHKVWISTVQSEVGTIPRTAPNSITTEPNYDPTLVPGRTYYWAVDELDSGESVVTGGQGNLWSFEVPYCVPGTEPNDVDGNLNGDCFIDFKDFAIMADNWAIDGLWP